MFSGGRDQPDLGRGGPRVDRPPEVYGREPSSSCGLRRRTWTAGFASPPSLLPPGRAKPSNRQLGPSRRTDGGGPRTTAEALRSATPAPRRETAHSLTRDRAPRCQRPRMGQPPRTAALQRRSQPPVGWQPTQALAPGVHCPAWIGFVVTLASGPVAPVVPADPCTGGIACLPNLWLVLIGTCDCVFWRYDQVIQRR